MKSTLILAGMIGAASVGGFAFAAPASASCSPSFTSIPCTIVTNVAQAPGQIVAGVATAPIVAGVTLSQAPGQLLLGQNCSPLTASPCGLPAVPGQTIANLAAAPGQLASNLAAAPGTLASSLASAPSDFVSALKHGGTKPADPATP